jgi:Ca2+-binding EF-hand superfamily protein
MLSDLQTKKLTRYFQVYDIDDDGRIASTDFERIVENVRVLHGAGAGSSGSDALREAYMGLWERLRSSADGDGDDSVDLDEWLAYWQLALEDDERYETEVQTITDRLFSVFDLDEDDAIGKDEFADFYGIFGLAVSLAETIFVELDLDGDGVITRSELLDISRDFYRGDDVEAPGNVLFGPYGA